MKLITLDLVSKVSIVWTIYSKKLNMHAWVNETLRIILPIKDGETHWVFERKEAFSVRYYSQRGCASLPSLLLTKERRLIDRMIGNRLHH